MIVFPRSGNETRSKRVASISMNARVRLIRRSNSALIRDRNQMEPSGSDGSDRRCDSFLDHFQFRSSILPSRPSLPVALFCSITQNVRGIRDASRVRENDEDQSTRTTSLDREDLRARKEEEEREEGETAPANRWEFDITFPGSHARRARQEISESRDSRFR
jgi:hypothetical protein